MFLLLLRILVELFIFGDMKLVDFLVVIFLKDIFLLLLCIIYFILIVFSSIRLIKVD